MVFLSLVFGSGSSPTVWGRFAAMAGRLIAATFQYGDSLRTQIYVDDPIFVARGNQRDRTRSFTKALLCLAIFGYPLAWHKAAAGARLTWIGAEVEVSRTEVRVRIPKPKVESLTTEAKQILSKDIVSIRSMRSFSGQVSFFAGLIPHLRPFLSGCWAAIAAATAKAKGRSSNEGGNTSRRMRAPTTIVHVQQARHSLSWILAFLVGSSSGITRRFPICTNRVRESGSFIATVASPWGIGGILVRKGEVV